jgi:hypothetical protein
VRVTQVTVCALAEGHPQHDAYSIVVAYRGYDRWEVQRLGRYLSDTGTWDAPAPDDGPWRTAHLFDRDTAEALAVKAAPDVTCNGMRAKDVAKEAGT